MRTHVVKKRNVVTQDKVDRQTLELAIQTQGNAIPSAVATMLRLVAPVLVRIAIRYVARRYRKKISDKAVNATGDYASKLISTIINRYSDLNTSSVSKTS